MSQRRKINCGRAKIKISPYQVASYMYFYHIKQEYSTEQLLAFYWHGLGPQGRLRRRIGYQNDKSQFSGGKTFEY